MGLQGFCGTRRRESIVGVVMKQNAALAFVMRHHNSYLTRTHLHPISFFVSSFSLSLSFTSVFFLKNIFHIFPYGRKERTDTGSWAVGGSHLKGLRKTGDVMLLHGFKILINLAVVHWFQISKLTFILF